MTINVHEKLAYIKDVSPHSEANLSRIGELVSSDNMLRVAVFGKYNHGKSTLLNALIGEEIFSAADRRETVEVSEHRHNGVVWIDTPGLDADIDGEDDRKAKAAALKRADTLCLVHNVRTGELDRSELDIYRQLMKQCRNYKRKIMVVLTQIDQLEESDLCKVQSTIKDQLPDSVVIPVSAVRYRKGIEEGKSLLVERSNLDSLLIHLEEMKSRLLEQRKSEMSDLIRKTRMELTELETELKGERNRVNNDIQKDRRKLIKDLDLMREDLHWFVNDIYSPNGVVDNFDWGYFMKKKSLFSGEAIIDGLNCLKAEVGD